MTETTMKNQEILNALNEKIKAAEEALLYLNQTKAGLERVIEMQKSPAEEAFKRVYGRYPVTDIADTCWDGYGWVHFEAGYHSAKEEKVSEYPYKKYTPEETEKNLKDAMKTAKENGVFDEPKPEPETLTLKQLLKKWVFDFSGKWAKNMITSELYEEEVERFIQMFIEWMPDAVVTDIGRSELWNGGYNAYRKILMGKLK
jgi:hypothetical protein